VGCKGTKSKITNSLREILNALPGLAAARVTELSCDGVVIRFSPPPIAEGVNWMSREKDQSGSDRFCELIKQKWAIQDAREDTRHPDDEDYAQYIDDMSGEACDNQPHSDNLTNVTERDRDNLNVAGTGITDTPPAENAGEQIDWDTAHIG